MLSQKLQDDLMSAYQQVYEAKRGHAAGDSDVEKQASQLASDVRYKAKGKVKEGASEEEKKKVFMQILGASPAPTAVKSMAKTKLLGEERFPDGPEGTAKRLKALAKKRKIPMDKMKKHPQFQPEEFAKTGMTKGTGKPSGAMKKYLDNAKKMQEADKKKKKTGNPAFDDPSHHSNARGNIGSRYEHVSFKSYFTEGNKTARMLHKSKTSVTGNISADRGGDEKKNKESRKGLEKDLKKKGIGYTKGVGKYKYDSGETGTEVSYQTSKPAKMSKRKFGKTMRRLGRKHGQESVVTKDKNKPARLHDTESKKPGKSINIGKSKPGSNPSGEGETSGNKVRGKSLPKKQNKGAYHYG